MPRTIFYAGKIVNGVPYDAYVLMVHRRTRIRIFTDKTKFCQLRGSMTQYLFDQQAFYTLWQVVPMRADASTTVGTHATVQAALLSASMTSDGTLMTIL
jgi:hypothetical protein